MADLTLSPVAPHPSVVEVVSRQLTVGPLRATCDMCDRHLCTVNRGTHPRIILDGIPRLPVEDFCRWCARPMTARGLRLSDNAGFVAFARLFTGRRQAQPPRRERVPKL